MGGWKRLNASSRIYMGLGSANHRWSTRSQARTVCRKSLSHSVRSAVEQRKRVYLVSRVTNNQSESTDGVSPSASHLSTVKFELTTMGAVLG